jgi:hypothetical protein
LCQASSPFQWHLWLQAIPQGMGRKHIWTIKYLWGFLIQDLPTFAWAALPSRSSSRDFRCVPPCPDFDSFGCIHRVVWLDHLVVLFSFFEGTSIIVLICIPPSNE